jgi:transposase-like protein
MKSVVRIEGKGKEKEGPHHGGTEGVDLGDGDATVAVIQALIPLGLRAAGEALKAEVERLAGPRHSRTGRRPGHVRWSQERGSVYLLDQKLPITYTRVRDRLRNQEVPLATYQQLQRPRQADAGLFRKVLLGLSCRNYAACAEAVPAAFGLSPSTVSRRFIRASAKKLRQLQERRLGRYEFVALVLDGKTCAEDQLVIALGITVTGEKVLLGFVQTATETERVCAAFLHELVDRGLKTDQGLLCVLDGAKGLRKALQTVFAGQAVVQRCQWHKRENVLAYLPKGQRPAWRRKLQQAYERLDYATAKAALLRCRQELRVLNASAVKSLDEGLEETLTLHRLGVFEALGVSLKTTNCLESLNALVAQRTAKVTRWRTADQKHRWLAAALLDIEPRLRRIKGYRALPLLRAALQAESRGKLTATGDQAA